MPGKSMAHRKERHGRACAAPRRWPRALAVMVLGALAPSGGAVAASQQHLSAPGGAQPATTRGAVRSRLPRAPAIVLLHGTLIDGTGAPPLHDAAVVVLGERIATVGTSSDVQVPPGAMVKDLRGATLLPGLGNAHVHSLYSPSLLRAWAQAGVTLVRDLAGPESFAAVDASNRQPDRARLVAAGPFITVPGGYPIVPWGTPWAVTIASEEEARQAVSRLVDSGADLIKISLESGADGSIPRLSLAQAKAVVETAHTLGVPVSAHVDFSRDLERAVDAGVDDVAHMVVDRLPEALVQRMVQSRIVWVPTLELWRCVNRRTYEQAVDNLRRFFASGGEVALGTDYDGYPCTFEVGMPNREIDAMSLAGMSAMQIIVAATRNVSRACRLDRDLGTVQPGKIADLLAVEGDPLADLAHLNAVRLVVRGGVVIREEPPS